MKRRIYLFVAVALGYMCSIAFGQPLQPGDIAAPVVKGPDVFETGLLSASITCPGQVQAGSVLVLDVSGTSAGDAELILRPEVPSGAVYRDSNGIHIAVWIVRTGHYVALWVVTAGKDISTDTVAFEVVAGDVPDDPPEPPPDDEFVEFIAEALEKVEAANHAEVAAIFRALADRIDRSELRLSEQIQIATEAALFGPQKKLKREWVGFYNAVFREMLVGMNVGLPEHWSAAFRTIAREVSP